MVRSCSTPAVQLLRQPVPQIECDIGQFVVWVGAAQEHRVQDGDGEVGGGGGSGHHAEQERFAQLGKDPENKNNCQKVEKMDAGRK